MFKFYSKESLNYEYQRLENLKLIKETVGAYNYKENKSNIQWEQFQQFPCPENIFINVNILKKALKICKLILKNEHNLNSFNDYVKNELKPHDWQFSNNNGQLRLSKIFNEKTW